MERIEKTGHGTRRKIHRKGAGTLFVLFLGVLIVLGIIIVVLAQKKQLVDYIGKSQTSLINAYDFSEKAFLYMDVSTGMSAKAAAGKITATAGFLDNSDETEQASYPCGAAVYPLLNDGKTIEKCKPDYKENFRQAFQDGFNSLLDKYKYSTLIDSAILSSVSADDDLTVKVQSEGNINFPIVSGLRSYSLIGQSEGIPEILDSGSYTLNSQGYLQRAGLNSASRNGVKIDSIVLHYTVSKSVDSAYNELKSSGKSYHYIIDKDGKIFQFVPEDRAAQHAGCIGKPSTVSCEPGWNSRSIGISFVNCGFDNSLCSVSCSASEKINNRCWDSYPDAQREAAAKLIAQIISRNPTIKLDVASIKSHSEISSDKSDPGPALDKLQLMAEAKSISDQMQMQNV